MGEQNIVAIVMALVGTPLSAVIAWLVSRKKSSAERDNLVVQGAGDVVKLMKEGLATLQADVADLRTRVETLEQENKDLRRDKATLERSIVALEQRVTTLMEDNAGLTQQVANLTHERDQLRAALAALNAAAGSPSEPPNGP